MDKKRTLKKFCNGFTLLEILFVIVILAGVMVTWVIYTQRGSTQKMVDKTAEQMLQLIEASRGYFSNQLYYWPTSFDNLITAGYITKSGQCSSWQTVKYSSKDCSNKEAYQLYWSNTADTSKAKIFGVSIVVGTEEIANQIIAQLPMNNLKQLSPTQWQVFALTTVPAVAADLEGKIIKVGTVMSNQIHNNNSSQRSDWKTPSGNAASDAQHGYVKKPNCPDPLQPAIFFSAYDYLLAHAVGGAGAPTRSVDVWCETGVKNPNDPTQLSIGFNSYEPSSDGKECNGAGYPAYAGPQFCDYEPLLNYDPATPVDYSSYWRLNYWACQNKGFTITDGDKASLIYFVTCLDPAPSRKSFFYPFSPTNQTDIITFPNSRGNMTNQTVLCLKDQLYTTPNYYAGCFYPTGCAYKNTTQSTFTYCQRKRRRCINPQQTANPKLIVPNDKCVDIDPYS